MPRPTEKPTPKNRDGVWYLIRRVPSQFAQFDDRRIVRMSTEIRVADDPRAVRATKKVEQLDKALWELWTSRRDSAQGDLEATFRAAVRRARSLGFSYNPIQELASDLPVEQVLARVEALDRGGMVEDVEAVTGVLGGAARQRLTTSKMLDEYEALNAATLSVKSPRQMHRWRVQRGTAVRSFIDTLGEDKALEDITRQDVLAFRQVLQDRVLAEEIEIDTANKQIGRVASMYRAINEAHQLDLRPVFDRAMIRGGRDKQRVAFPAPFVQDRFLADGVFDDLNEEARRCLFLIAETGLRLSEACNLNKTTIILDHEVPHVLVKPDGREMKTPQSEREIPLVGVALEAMKAQPNGFPRYADKGDSLSALVNKVLDARKLRPLEGQSLYSLRHTFEDRLTAVEAPEKVVASLMGHKWYRPRYGEGPSLAQKAEWLNKIAFRPPSRV